MKHALLAAALCLALGGCAANQQAQVDAFRQQLHEAVASDIYKAGQLADYNGDKGAKTCWVALGDFVTRFGRGGPDELTFGGAQAVQVFLDTQNPQSVLRVACDPVKQRLVVIVRNAIASYGLSLIP